MVNIADFIANWRSSLFAGLHLQPWALTANAEQILINAINELNSDYSVNNNVAVHHSATVEAGAIVKKPAILGPRSFVAANAYLRGGIFLDQGCIVGPACEVKTTFLFALTKVAHLSFVGDSVIGSNVNIEAGAIIANYRNEMHDKTIRILYGTGIIDTGVEKFGSLIGDEVKIGANSTIAPGAIFAKGTCIPRLSKIDQHPSQQP